MPHYYVYDDIGGHHELTEQQVLKVFWPWWSKKMREKGLTPTHDQCLEDYRTIHWAQVEWRDT